VSGPGANAGSSSEGPTRLLIYEPSHRRIAKELAAHGAALELLLMDEAGRLTLGGVEVTAEEASAEAAWANGDVFASGAARAFMTAMLKAPRLKWVQSAAAGFDHPVFGSLIAKGARLTTSHGQAVGMADYVLAGVLDYFQRGGERRTAQVESAWRRLPFREIAGTTWLIIGFGAIGQAVAQRARAFGARTVGARRNAAPHPLADAVISMRALGDHLPAADVVVLCAPLDAATRHLANAAFLGALKTGAVLVNVGRGGLVDETALLAALDAGTPAHAVLDVFETEPLPVGSPFWRHPRVSVTAHASGIANGQDARNQALFLENLGRYLAGQPLLHEVDPRDVPTPAN
jgi:phosphoglycerate dehydrogenase-like enzyme